MTVLLKSSDEWVTIPHLAQRLRVTPASVRYWLRRGYIEPPEILPATGERVYSREAVKRIQNWYTDWAAKGRTRGRNSAVRRTRAQRRNNLIAFVSALKSK